MKKYKEQLEDLESRILSELRHLIETSQIDSKHIAHKAIKVNVFGYEELTVVNDRLTFIDEGGYEYSLNADCNLEDLVDILSTFGL